MIIHFDSFLAKDVKEDKPIDQMPAEEVEEEDIEEVNETENNNVNNAVSTFLATRIFIYLSSMKS